MHRDERAVIEVALIAGLITGDLTAASQFHTRYGERINRWIWRLLGADRDHDDVVQQVFVGILSSLENINNLESLDSWVDSVTIRTVRKVIRKRKLKRALFIAHGNDDMDEVPHSDNPLKQAYIRRFYAVLDKMPADDRIVFVLRHLEGHSLEEIAQIGEYSLSTAKRRLKKAKSVFKKRVTRDVVLLSMLEENGYEA